MRILITGTSGGVGGAVKKAALAEGHVVAAVNRADFEDLRGKLMELAAPIDAVIFCTGMCPVKPVALTSDELIAETLRVNCSLFLKLMRTIIAEKLYNSAGMKALAVSSVSATEGWPGGAAYCASKGALSAMCRAMAVELQPKQISVKCLEPRYIKTKMFDLGAGRMGVPETAAISPDAFAAQVMKELT